METVLRNVHPVFIFLLAEKWQFNTIKMNEKELNDLLENLIQQINESKRVGEDPYSVSWLSQTGVILTQNQAIKIYDLIRGQL